MIAGKRQPACATVTAAVSASAERSASSCPSTRTVGSFDGLETLREPLCVRWAPENAAKAPDG